MYEELTSEFASPDVLVREGVHNPPPACFVDLFRHVSDNRTFYEAMLTSEGGAPLRGAAGGVPDRAVAGPPRSRA
jgi:hypothetical protein